MIEFLFKKLFLAVFFLSLVFAGGVKAQESSVVSAMLEEAGGDITVLDDIIREHEGLLNKYPDSDFAPTLMFQLAELYYERSQMAYQNDMRNYEQKMAAFQNNESAEEPAQPHLDMSKTIAFCSRLLQERPELKFRDKVIYKLAVAYMDEGDADNAQKYFNDLTNESPDSPMALESHFRIGEYFFDKRQFEQAIEHYKILLNHWDNPFFDMALYKLGWSYYNQQNYADAISNFLVLIEDINLVDSLKSKQGSATKVDLRTESIHYIAGSFTEYGGAKQAAKFLKPLKDKTYTAPILVKMAELYENRNAYAEAIESYRLLLDFYPFYKKAPHIFSNIVKNYESAEDDSAAIHAREEAVAYFRPGSAWQQHYVSGEDSQAGRSSAKDNLVYLGTTFQARAQQTNSPVLYDKAIEKYSDYIQTFAKEDNTSEIHYYLAECFYNIGDYTQAAETYNKVATRYPDSPYREKAAFNRIFSYVQLLDSTQTSTADTIKLAPFVLTGDSAVIIVDDKIAGRVISAGNDFALHFPQSEWLDQVYMKLGEILSAQQKYVHAAAAYQRVYEKQPASQYQPAAAINVGQCLFDGGYFSEATDWFDKVATAFADSTQLAAKAKNMAALSKFKIAEKLSTDSQPVAAADILLSIASSPNEAALQERALFDAAVQYQAADSLLKAARTFERLAESHPASTLGDKALYQAALIRETLQDWQLAAHDYLSLVDHYPESPLLQQALKNAAQSYVNADKWIAAKVSFMRYADMFADDYDNVIEFTCRAGDMAFNAGQKAEAQNLFQTTLQKFKQFNADGHPVDAYFAAQAQFMIGEILFEKYRSIELTPPLQTNFKKKVAEFNNVAKAYAEAIKYQIADWSTAASHRIGMSFEEFARAFLESPIPDDLDETQQMEYKEKLAERAGSYQEKALQTYQKNIEQAEANGIDNSWVTQSRERARALQNELPDKTAAYNDLEDK